MVKQLYLQEDIRDGIFKNFFTTYKKMLIDTTFKDEKLVRDMIEFGKANRMLNQAIFNAFKGKDYGVYVRQYEKLTGDGNLKNYIEIYKALIDETAFALYDTKGQFHPEFIEKYFKMFNSIINEIYSTLERDCEEGYYWWLKNDATALRRQLSNDVVFFSDDRMDALCEKFLGHPYDGKRFEDPDYNKSLIKKLDAIMEKQGAQIKYVWKEKDSNNNVRKIESSTPPKDVHYYITVYKSKENEKIM